MRQTRFAFIIFLIGLIINCSNTEKEKDAEQGKKNRPITLLLLIQSEQARITAATYKSPLIESDTAYGIGEFMRQTYNSLVAGTAGGTVNRTMNCTGGGTLRLSGTATTSSSITTIDLSYLMDKCKFENTYSGSFTSIVKLTITGTIRQVGTVASSGSSHTSTGTSLTLDGTVQNSYYTLNTPYAYSNTICDYQRILSGGVQSGNVCGKSYSY